MVPSEFVAFDLETTGLSPRSDEIIEIGAVRFGRDLRPLARFELVVDPRRPIPLAVQRLTGIGPGDVEGAPTPAEAAGQLAEFSQGARLVAHGADMDIGFCAAVLPAAFAGRPVLDTLDLARILLPVAPSHSLYQLSARLGLCHERPHRAGSDAEATRALLGHLIQVAEALPASVLAQGRRLVAGMDLPLAEFFTQVVLASGSPGGGRTPQAAPGRDAPPVRRGAAPRKGDASTGLAADAAAVLGPGGALARAMPEYELREAQVEMARAVAQTLERSGRVLVEAGTGIGKSLAYLVPLALWSARTGRRSVVATHTTTLQEQLGERDVPTVVEQLHLGISHAVLKGRQHYISLRRWHRFLANDEHGPSGSGLDVLRFKLKILCWLSLATTTGDRSELHLSGSEEGLWQRVQSDTDDCLGPACANWRTAACHMVAARKAAANADIVVTNHALLLASAERQGQVLAAYSALVVDEAHHLEEAASEQLGSSLRAGDVLRVVDRLGGGGESPLQAALSLCREATQRLFGDVKGCIGELCGPENPGNATVGLTEELRSQPRFQRVLKSAWHLVRVLGEGSRSLLEARGGAPLQEAFFPQPDRVDEELELAAAALTDAAQVVERVLLVPRPGYVSWMELRAEQAEIHEAPVSVSEQLSEALFDRVDAAVLTSATLAVAGSFEFIRARTGVGAGADELLLSSPFDYLTQALCVQATDMPPYDDPAYDAALADLCSDLALALGGRTLVLFTGYAPLRSVHSLVRPRLEPAGIAVLGQGLDGTRRQVLASFLQNQRTLLLGTSTFWEGIDVPGDALSCVVIAKLPFPVPTDPLIQARSALLRDGFLELALPLAVLRLKQGFGRLIRRGTDRGAVVLCDGRLASRDYGRAFLRALPEAPAVQASRLEVPRLVEAFIRYAELPPGAVTMTELHAAAGVEAS